MKHRSAALFVIDSRDLLQAICNPDRVSRGASKKAFLLTTLSNNEKSSGSVSLHGKVP